MKQKEQPTSKIIGFNADPKLQTRLQRLAEEEERSVAQMIRRLLNQALDQRERETA